MTLKKMHDLQDSIDTRLRPGTLPPGQHETLGKSKNPTPPRKYSGEDSQEDDSFKLWGEERDRSNTVVTVDLLKDF